MCCNEPLAIKVEYLENAEWSCIKCGKGRSFYTFQFGSIPHAISKENFAILASRFIIVSFGNIYHSVMQLTSAYENDSVSTGIPFAVSLMYR